MSTECLKKETVLNHRYKIIKKLGQGGFGVTYLVMDCEIEQYVVLKECFPLHLTERDEESGHIKPIHNENEPIFERELKKFLDEARRMAKLQHISEITKVLGYFRENNTAYIVMEYVRGTNLRTFLEGLDEPFTFEKGRDFLLPVIRALDEVHKKGLIHRDLTPENILIKEDKSIKVIDFGSSREYVDDRTKTILVKSGYAPLEQYSKKEKQGPWTDVYGICAVFYEMITGAAPQDSLSRMEADELYPPSMYGADLNPEEEDVLMRGLAQNYQQRYQSMKQLEQELLLTCDKSVFAKDISVKDISAKDISVKDISAKDISVKDISVKNISDKNILVKNSFSKERKGKKVLKRHILGAVCGAVVLCGIIGTFFYSKWNEKNADQNAENIEIVNYAGNYTRDSERYLEFQKYVKETAVSSEIDETSEYWILTEEAVLEWGEPCNQMRFHKKLDEWLEDIAECGWELHLKEECTDSLFEVVIKKYGAIETNFLKQNVYTWNEAADIYISYDPVNEEILEVSVVRNEEGQLETGDELILITADALITLSEYDEIEKKKLIESLKQGTKEKNEKMGNVYLSQSFVDVHVIYGWLEQQEIFYKCKPYEEMSFGMRYEYYWP